jgi:hypothetical protein
MQRNEHRILWIRRHCCERLETEVEEKHRDYHNYEQTHRYDTIAATRVNGKLHSPSLNYRTEERVVAVKLRLERFRKFLGRRRRVEIRSLLLSQMWDAINLLWLLIVVPAGHGGAQKLDSKLAKSNNQEEDEAVAALGMYC